MGNEDGSFDDCVILFNGLPSAENRIPWLWESPFFFRSWNKPNKSARARWGNCSVSLLRTCSFALDALLTHNDRRLFGNKDLRILILGLDG